MVQANEELLAHAQLRFKIFEDKLTEAVLQQERDVVYCLGVEEKTLLIILMGALKNVVIGSKFCQLV